LKHSQESIEMKAATGPSRRSIICRVGSFSISSVLGLSLFTKKVAAGSGKKASAFALIGDRWHNPDYIRTALTKTLVKGIGLSIDFTNEVTDLSTETLDGYTLLIIFRDGMIIPEGYKEPFSIYDPRDTTIYSDPPLPEFDEKPQMWMTGTQGKAVREFVENGGSAFFWHNASHISLSNKDFRDVEGAIYTGHPPLIPFKVKIVNRDHPITRGVNDFIVTDDQHYVIYDKDPRHVLMKSQNFSVDYTGSHGSQGRECECCWAYEYGKGRVCFMSPGHMITTLWNPEYIKVQQNAARWLLRQI